MDGAGNFFRSRYFSLVLEPDVVRINGRILSHRKAHMSRMIRKVDH